MARGGIPVRMTLTFNRIPELTSSMRAAAEREVLRSAYEIEAEAKRRVPVDTGALRNSIQTWRSGSLRASVAPHMEYAAFVEFGTRKQRARPYMVPAAEYVRPKFVEAMRRIVGG